LRREFDGPCREVLADDAVRVFAATSGEESLDRHGT
jgi:hypothetical protein